MIHRNPSEAGDQDCILSLSKFQEIVKDRKHGVFHIFTGLQKSGDMNSNKEEQPHAFQFAGRYMKGIHISSLDNKSELSGSVITQR